VIRTDVTPERQFAARWTFYIGTDGRILAIDKSPTTGTAGEVMVKRLEELGVRKKQGTPLAPSQLLRSEQP
jgi:hypothetical protein